MSASGPWPRTQPAQTHLREREREHGGGYIEGREREKGWESNRGRQRQDTDGRDRKRGGYKKREQDGGEK